jgi:hypothetical protein
LFCICSDERRCLIVGAMKMTSLSRSQGGERNGVLELPWRWGAAFLGHRRAADRAIAGRTIEFALDRNSLWRIAGSVRGVRIGCRQGRLWLTQAGAAADVILQPGQSFVAKAEGTIVVQSVPSFNATDEAALGTLTVTTGAARLKIHRGQTAAAPARIGLDLADRDRTGMWEERAFIAVWLCAVFGVWYCLKTVLLLPWPQ